MVTAVPAVDLGQAPTHRHRLAVRAGCHIAEGQRIGQWPRRRLELSAQDVGQAPLFGLDDGAGMMRDQTAQHRVGVLDITQVPGTVQAVQPGAGQLREIADVM